MTTSQLRAKQIADLQAQQAAYERKVEEALKSAGYARCAVVEDLYELMGIEASQRKRKNRNGEIIQVLSDRDESDRTARLIEAVSSLLNSSEPLSAPLFPPATSA
ncbi:MULTISPECIES: hypothetical protein [unclassified Microbacterium]|uniref:hypothetical protein n=1 Tax=unclassified Microbacterium TaxID=2609290 RepID=UPI003139B014